MADDGAKRSDGGILAPPNPLLHNAEDSNPETGRISPEDCYDPQDSIFNSNLLHWETVLLGDVIKAAPPTARAGKSAALADNISDAGSKEEKAVLPTALPEVKPLAKRVDASTKLSDASTKLSDASTKLSDVSANQPEASAKQMDVSAKQAETKAERPSALGRAKSALKIDEKPVAKTAVKSVDKPAISAEVTAETAREMAEIAPLEETRVTASTGAEQTAALKASLDAGHGGGEKKSSGLFGRLFGGAKKATAGAAVVSATVKAVDTASVEAVKLSGAAAVEVAKSAVELVAETTAKTETTPASIATAKTERVSNTATAKTERTANTATANTERTANTATAKTERAVNTATAKTERAVNTAVAKTERTANTATAKTERTANTATANTERTANTATAKTERVANTATAKTVRASTATVEKPTLAKREQADAAPAKTVTAGAMKGAALRHAKSAKKAADRPLSASNSLYRYFYFTGIQLMRSIRKRRKYLAGIASEGRQRLAENRAKHRRSVKATRHVRKMELHVPFADLREKYKVFANDLKNARQYGSMGATLKVFTQMSGFVIKSGWRVLSVVLNYAAPIAACVLVALYVTRESSATMALKVEYNGVDLGYIADESVFTKAANDMKSRMILGDVYVADPTNDDASKVTYAEQQSAEQLARTNSLVVPQYTLMSVNPNEILTADELTNSLIRAAGKSDGNPDGFAIEEADGLYIDNYYIGAVTDGKGLLDTMSGMLDEYVTDIEETDGPIKAQFVKKVQVKRGLYPTNSIRPLGEIQTLLRQEASGTKQYTVVSGDTPLRIASKNGISFDELKILNPEVETNLQPGDTLLIAKSAPYLGVKISKTIKYEENVKYSIIQKIDKDRAVGYSATTQKGSEGVNEITAEVVMIDGIESERNILDTRVVKKPVDQIVLIGGTRKVTVIPSDSSGQVSSGAFAWPAPVHNIGTGFLGYYGHTGADIVWGGCYGSPIYASAGGVVVASGWGGAYGNRIIIDHGGGVKTLYAHCSELYVGVGTVVSQGQTIAAIGRTGNVTGPHLHFEILINGTAVNPARYLY